MTAPAKNFTVIADTSIDADSPLDITLMQSLRDNDQHIEEWVGKDYTAHVNHDHDGVNSAQVAGQQITLFNEIGSTTSTSFVDIDSIYIYIPSNISTLTYYVHSRVDTAGRADFRLRAGATNGTTVQGTETGTTYEWKGAGTLDVSALSGWTEISMQLLHTTGSYSAYAKKAVCRMTA